MWVMDDAGIRKRVESLIALWMGGEANEQQASEALQGMTGIIELLYGRDSSQLAAFREGNSVHRANLTSLPTGKQRLTWLWGSYATFSLSWTPV